MTQTSITTRVANNLRDQGVTVYHRGQWGSLYPEVYQQRRTTRPAQQPADTVFQHITVTRPTEDFLHDVRVVEQIGYERFGSGVSYNWLINMETGEVAVGQPLDAKGTHTVNIKRQPRFSYDQNLVARAIAGIGMPETDFSKRAMKSTAKLLVAMIEEGAITEGFDYKPHSFVAYKDCPCDAMRNAMPAIQKVALSRLARRRDDR
jgi:hypothetical protein